MYKFGCIVILFTPNNLSLLLINYLLLRLLLKLVFVLLFSCNRNKSVSKGFWLPSLCLTRNSKNKCKIYSIFGQKYAINLYSLYWIFCSYSYQCHLHPKLSNPIDLIYDLFLKSILQFWKPNQIWLQTLPQSW